MKVNKENKQYQKLQQALQPDVLNEAEKINQEVFSKADNQGKKYLLKTGFESALRKADANLITNFKCFNLEHQDNEPSMRYNKEKLSYHCFGCMEAGQNYDLYDAVKDVYGLKGFKDSYSKAIELFVQNGEKVVEVEKSQNPNFTFTKEMYKVMRYDFHNAITEDPLGLEYLQKRGISKETAKKHGLQTWNYQGHWYIVFINDNGSLVRRKFAEDEEITRMYCDIPPSKWWNQAGKSGIFNLRGIERAKYYNKVIFVNESAMDTLSVEELGFFGVALNSANNLSLLLRETTYPYLAGLFDNDSIGINRNSNLREHGHYAIDFDEFEHLKKFKDVNEALVADREATKRDLQQLEVKAREFYNI